MMRIKVPATTANLGPGFDSCGLALSLYLELDVTPADTWFIEHQLGDGIPTDASNLIIETALALAPHIQPQHLVMRCDIPSTRGLGSSAAAIVAGIELANQLGELKLSSEEKMRIATNIEGHPDNVAPAVFGGLVIAVQLGEETRYTRHNFPNCDIVAFIPQTELATTLSRSVLPEELPYGTAVKASAISNVMLSSLLSGDLKQMGEMMAQDLFHEHYRKSLVPQLELLRERVKTFDAYGCCLSGAGPTVLILSQPEQTAALMADLKSFDSTANLIHLNVDTVGIQVN